MSATSKPHTPTQDAAPFEKAPAKRPIFPAWAWAAAVALALITGYSIRRMTTQTSQLAILHQQMDLAALQNRALQDQLDQGLKVAAIMTSSDSTPLKLVPKDANLPLIHAYLHPNMVVAITADQMPAMPAARTLQLWFIPENGQPLSAAIFRPDSQGQVALIAPINMPMYEIAALAVSEEPAGGSARPTTAPGWVVQLH